MKIKEAIHSLVVGVIFVSLAAYLLVPTGNLIAAAGAASPPPVYELSAVSAWEKGHENNSMLVKLMNLIETKCQTKDGKLKLTWRGGPETFKALDLPDTCRAGSVNVFYSSVFYYTGIVPETNIAAIPFIVTYDNGLKFWRSGIGDIIDRAWRNQGLRIIGVASMVNMFFYTTKPFAKLGDFKGKQIRGPGGLPNVWISAIGAVPTQLASAEVYGAMQRGTVDGGLQPLSSYRQYGYNEIAPYLLDLPVYTLGAWYWINSKKFDSLPTSLQESLSQVIRSEEGNVIGWNKEQEQGQREDVKKRGAKFVSLSNEDQKKFREVVFEASKAKLVQLCPEEPLKRAFEIVEKFR